MWKMHRMYVWVLSLTGIMANTPCCMGSQRTRSVDTSTVTTLDVSRFMGQWYEIARYDHRFERGMTRVMAEYTLLSDGDIRVQNSGWKDGKFKQITGKARLPDPIRYPGRLEVSFFLWFYSDYYVLEVAPDYRYAVVGSSSDKYLWILCRTPQMPKHTLEHILSNLRTRGYDLSRLVYGQY